MNENSKPPQNSRVVSARITIGADGSINYEGDPAAIAEAIEADVRGRAREQRRGKAWGNIGAESMTRLAALFPSLRAAPGVSPWNANEFLRWATSGVLSHGEVLAAKFVLGVWNSSTDWEDTAREMKLIKPDQKFSRFDLFEAMNVWDQAHINAALAWIELPFSP